MKSIKLIHLIMSLACVVMISACASNRNIAVKPVVNLNELPQYLRDDIFATDQQTMPIQKVALLALPENTKYFLDNYVAPLETEQERYQALRQWVFDQFANYQYDAMETLAIGDLINSRKINCLSFSAMFVAAARYVDIPASFQLVYAPPYWDADGDTWIINQHVNVYGDIKLSQPTGSVYQDLDFFLNRMDVLYYRDPEPLRYRRNSRHRYVVDINRAVVSIPFKTRPLNDEQLLALFYNNKAGEALHSGDLTLSYLYVKAALEVDRSLASVWNTLGVLYQRRGELAMAEKVYQIAIKSGEDTYTAQSNLAGVYRLVGKTELAAQLEAAVADYRQANPYYHYALGDESLNNDEVDSAKQYFQQAITLKHNEELFYYALAKTEVKLGNYQAVEENLKNARTYAKGPDKKRYSNKLEMFAQAIADAQGR